MQRKISNFFSSNPTTSSNQNCEYSDAEEADENLVLELDLSLTDQEDEERPGSKANNLLSI